MRRRLAQSFHGLPSFGGGGGGVWLAPPSSAADIVDPIAGAAMPMNTAIASPAILAAANAIPDPDMTNPFIGIRTGAFRYAVSAYQ